MQQLSLFDEPPESRPQSSRDPILVGTASWAEPEFIKAWYPRGLPAHERLTWYATHFAMVELNSSFYGIPTVANVEKWQAQTPPGFRFNVKLHRYFSRHKTPADALPAAVRGHAPLLPGHVGWSRETEKELLSVFLEAIEPMRRAGKLDTLLLQMAPGFSPTRHQWKEVEPLLNDLADYQVAVEVRDRRWLEGGELAETTAFLRGQGASLVSVDLPSGDDARLVPQVDVVTNPKLAYYRLHGRSADAFLHGKTIAERFDYRYDDEELQQIAARAQRLAEEANRVHVVFNNNRLDYAPDAAGRLRLLLPHEESS